jgi:sugar lactone lactonase YvrE
MISGWGRHKLRVSETCLSTFHPMVVQFPLELPQPSFPPRDCISFPLSEPISREQKSTNTVLGMLFRFNSDLSRHMIRPELTIPNGIGWSRDRKTLYFTHSTEKRILAFDYSTETGDITNERVFWEHDGAGDPDGFKMDADGYIWQAIYGESRVLRISPEGKVVGEITYPTRAITCPVFIGTELWVTTADEEDESQKYGGGLFKVDVGICGLPDFKFKLEKEVPGL